MTTGQAIMEGWRWHTETARQLWQVLPAGVLLLPFLVMLLLYGLDQTAISKWLVKDVAEIIAPVLLTVALLLSLVALAVGQHSYFRWLALLALALLLREWHFRGTDNGFYIAIVLLLWWASKYRERMQPFLQQRVLVGLFVAMMWTYLITKTFDRHYWDSWLPAGTSGDLFEENLELFGHLLFLMLVGASLRLRGLAGTTGSAGEQR